MNAIIFGANGQDGHYLNRLLQKKGYNVTGVSRSGPWLQGNVNDFDFVRNLIINLQPNLIFHFAANSTTRPEAWEENHGTICNGSLYILESVQKECPSAKVFISGSGLQFQNQNLPIRETDPFEATSHYAVSRIHSVYAARYYRSLGLKVYIGYFFNHDSPLRTERHMSSRIAAFAKRVKAGSSETMQIGDLHVEKEWGFAGDMMEGAWTLVNQDHVFETVIGTGKAYSISEWLDECFLIVGMEWTRRVTLLEGFLPEYKRLVSNPETLRNLGWNDNTSFAGLARLMIGN